jgi:hypothetical protein
MLASDLYNAFRSDVVDVEQPYLWSDDEVYRYMTDAYRMFARRTGGIPDATSTLTRVPIVAGQMYSDISPLILKFRRIFLQSTGARLHIANIEDSPLMRDNDYGALNPMRVDSTQGPVKYAVIGMERNKDAGKIRWVQVPAVDDAAQLVVYRLPLGSATADNADDFEFDEIGEEHHESLLLWMKHKAYSKQDAETFDRGRAKENKDAFEAYCLESAAEADRYKHKNRAVAYGGL